jgi:hypothetical protein
MNSFAPWHWSRLTAGVALTLLAGVPLAPSTARASCGDYVLMAGSHAPPRAEPMQHPIDTPRPAHPAPADKKLPCSGPLCSQRPFVPLPAPAAPVSLTGHPEWACALALPPLPRPGSLSYLPGDDPVRSVHRGASIFHPPR